MAKDPIVFAIANPTPEIMYDEAMAAGVKVMGTGRPISPTRSTTSWPSKGSSGGRWTAEPVISTMI